MDRHRLRMGTLCLGALLTGVLTAGLWEEPRQRYPGALDRAASRSSGEVAPEEVSRQSAARAEDGWGAFLGSGAEGIQRLKDFEQWLGGVEVKVGHTYLPGNTWTDIEGPEGLLRPWARWRQERRDRMLVVNVPMAERNEAGVSDDEVARLLREGARGSFDQHYRTLASRLVSWGAPDAVLVLGWEMNGSTYTHRCGPDPEAWKSYWNRVVRVMREASGQRFRFDFTPNRGEDSVPWTDCYPGDDTVDVIGMDSYDQPPGTSFREHVEQPLGLRAQVEFARQHHKRISYPEWGLFRGGDNVAYLRSMLDWFREQRPLYHTLTDYCPHGVWRCADNPRSREEFRSTMGRATRRAIPPEPSDQAGREECPPPHQRGLLGQAPARQDCRNPR